MSGRPKIGADGTRFRTFRRKSWAEREVCVFFYVLLMLKISHIEYQMLLNVLISICENNI